MDPIKARKRFGQNFLNDPVVINHIIAALAPDENQTLIEIGPGLGALTVPVLQKAGRLTVIELDRDIIPRLKSTCQPHGELTVINQDVLTVDFDQFERPFRVFGNLPYNISTPLVFHLLQYSHHIQDMLFMFQKELANRLCATPGTKAFGKLSVMVQYHYTVTPVIDVPPSSFTPQPKVDSAVARLVPIKEQNLAAHNLSTLDRVVTAAFAQRRKTLRNTLKNTISEKALEQLSINPAARAETLTVDQFVAMANLVDQKAG